MANDEARSDDARTIRVIGRGEATTVPDVATINVGIGLRRRTVGESTAEAAKLASRLVDAVKGAGVAATDVQTADYSVFPEHDHRADQQPAVVGYRVNYTLHVAVRDVDSLTSVLDAVVTAGGDATTINGLNFSVADDTAARRSARERAWQDAETKAEELAALSGLDLRSAVDIAEGPRGGGGGPMPRRRARAMSAEMAPPVESGESTITVVLHVAFEAAC